VAVPCRKTLNVGDRTLTRVSILLYLTEPEDCL
jgi:hypothetical protein